MKITVLGGGGVRSMFLAKSIAQKAKRLGIDELCFMDNDEEKLRIYGGMAFFPHCRPGGSGTGRRLCNHHHSGGAG